MRALLGCLLVLAVGCRFDATIPAGTVVTCSSHADCVDGLRCQQPQGRCVAADQLDTVPPAVTAASSVIIPGRDNPLPAPTAITFGTVLRVTITVSEALARPPALQSGWLFCSTAIAVGANYQFDCALPEGGTPAQGPTGLTAELEDLVGLTSSTPLPLEPTPVIDTLPPPAPAVQTPGLVVYTRVPQGSDGTAGVPSFSLSGQTGAAPEAVQVRARSRNLSRGSGVVGADGSFASFELSPLDTEQLEASSLDDAGNSSPWVTVRDGRWVATLNQKVAGSARKNFHRFAVSLAHGPALLRDDVTEKGEADGLAARDQRSVTVGGGASWARFGGLPQLGAAYSVNMVWDAARARTVLIAGPAVSVANEFHGLGWSTVPATNPGTDGDPDNRRNPVVVYDEAAQRTLLLGGLSDTSPPVVLRDSWAFDGQSWQRLGAGPPLVRAAAVFDPTRNQVVVAGGRLDGGALSGSTFIFENRAWTELPGSMPTPRLQPGLATDRRGTVLAFGGTLADGGLTAELDSFDGQRWTALPVAGPSPRQNAQLVFDEPRSRWLMLGGELAQGLPLTDLWAFDGGAWERLDAGTSLPAIAAATWDPVHQQLIAVSPIGRAEAFDGRRWSTHSQPTPLVGGTSLACSDDAGCFLVSADGVRQMGPTTWEPLGLPVPGADAGPVLAGWDHDRGALVVATWDSTLVWAPGQAGFTQTGTGLGNLQHSAMRQGVEGMLVLRNAGGTQLAIDGGWLTVGPPLGLDGGFAVYDEVALASLGPRALLAQAVRTAGTGCGGNYGSAVVEATRDGGAWENTVEATPFRLSTVGWDPVSARAWAFSGVASAAMQLSASTFEQADGGWVVSPIADAEQDSSPLPRILGKFSFDPSRRVGVLFGGASTAAPALDLSDTWVLSRADERPAAYFTVDLVSANLPTGWQPVSVQVSATAGATGSNGLQPVDGVKVLAFTDRRWRDVTALGGGPLAAPAATTAALATEDLAQLPRSESFTVALVPAGTNGAGQALLAVDYVELTLDYRLP